MVPDSSFQLYRWFQTAHFKFAYPWSLHKKKVGCIQNSSKLNVSEDFCSFFFFNTKCCFFNLEVKFLVSKKNFTHFFFASHKWRGGTVTVQESKFFPAFEKCFPSNNFDETSTMAQKVFLSGNKKNQASRRVDKWFRHCFQKKFDLFKF